MPYKIILLTLHHNPKKETERIFPLGFFFIDFIGIQI